MDILTDCMHMHAWNFLVAQPVDSLHAHGDSSPDSSSSDESSSQEVEHLPEVPRAQGPAVEPIDEDSDMECQDVSTGRDKGTPLSQS